jgi:hypothetical protein
MHAHRGTVVMRFDVRKLAKRNAEFYEELIDGRV